MATLNNLHFGCKAPRFISISTYYCTIELLGNPYTLFQKRVRQIASLEHYKSNLPDNFTKMIAGNIQYDDNLDKFKEISDIIDLSGSLETQGEKDISKIDIFLRNIKKI
mgnify:CR=1 FL=1